MSGKAGNHLPSQERLYATHGQVEKEDGRDAKYCHVGRKESTDGPY
jgi:hypothetical protein